MHSGLNGPESPGAEKTDLAIWMPRTSMVGEHSLALASVAPTAPQSEDVARICREDIVALKRVHRTSKTVQRTCVGVDKVRLAIHSVFRVRFMSDSPTYTFRFTAVLV